MELSSGTDCMNSSCISDIQADSNIQAEAAGSLLLD